MLPTQAYPVCQVCGRVLGQSEQSVCAFCLRDEAQYQLLTRCNRAWCAVKRFVNKCIRRQ